MRSESWANRELAAGCRCKATSRPESRALTMGAIWAAVRPVMVLVAACAVLLGVL